MEMKGRGEETKAKLKMDDKSKKTNKTKENLKTKDKSM